MASGIKKLTVLDKIGFGSGDVAVNISLLSISMLLTYFYTDIYQLKPEHMGILFLAVRILDAITDPCMGWITDKVNTRYGRYRPWLALAAIPFGISIYLLFYVPELSYNGKLIWAYAMYVLNTLMFTVVTIPYISMIGVISDDPAERLSANGYRFVMAKLAALIVTTFIPTIALYVGGAGGEAVGYPRIMGLMGVLSSACLFFCFFFTKEQVSVKIKPTSLIYQLRHLVKNDQWIILSLACILMMTAFLVRGGIAVHYSKYYLNAENWVFMLFLGMWSIGGICATFVSTFLTKHFCKVKVFKYSMLLAALNGVLMFYFVGQGDIYLGIFFYFVSCLLSDINTPIFWSSITEVIDYGEKKTGVRVSGLTLGSISLFQKAGMAIAGLIVGFMLAYYQYDPNVQLSDYTLSGISILLTIVPSIFFFTVYLIMNKFIISNEYYLEMQSIPVKED